MKKIVRGNDFALKIPVSKKVNGDIVPFPLAGCTDIKVQLVGSFSILTLAYTLDMEHDNVIIADVKGDRVKKDVYSLVVSGRKFGNAWQSKEYEQISIVEYNKDGDTEFGTTDEGDNSVEMDTAMVILPPSVELSDLIGKTNQALKDSEATNTILNANEDARMKAEVSRVSAESDRVRAEEKRIKAEEQRNKILAQAKSDCEAAAQAADSAAAAATTAKNKAELAAMEAEKVNITMQGSTITVTNKKGEQKSIDVIDTDETVTVKIASSVEGISIKGQKINVFLNHDTKTPQQYVTDETGTAIFSVHRGEYYEVNFTAYANAQPIAPVGYTAVRADREIAVEYMPYDEETSEKVIVTVTKYIDDVGSPWEGKTVQCTYDKKTTDYVTDSKGQTNILIPVGKEYTINVENEDGYYVKFYNNKRTYTAKVPQRMLAFNMYQFKTGLYCVDSNLNEYTIDEWVATGRDAEEVVAIKVADQNLMLNRGTFMMRTSDLRNTSALISRQWCTQNLLFESIATNGNNSKDANYWNGEQSTFLIRQEAQERSLSVPAAEYAYNTIFTIGEQDLHGFLMSIGQEYVHISNFGLIREMLRTLYGDTVAEAYYKFMSNNWRWTSTQTSSTNAWMFNSSAANSFKAASNRVLPVFAC